MSKTNKNFDSECFEKLCEGCNERRKQLYEHYISVGINEHDAMREADEAVFEEVGTEMELNNMNETNPNKQPNAFNLIKFNIINGRLYFNDIDITEFVVSYDLHGGDMNPDVHHLKIDLMVDI